MSQPYYQDDAVTLYHGDCREVREWLAASVLVTDPPYGMAYKSGWSGRSIAGDESVAVRDTALALWGDKPALVFGRWDCPKPEGAKMALTWSKGDWPGMGDLSLPWGPSTEEVYVLGGGFVGKRSGSVIHYDRLTGDTLHPNEKPVGLLQTLIAKCPPGIIADPFAGSGSTLVAAKAIGRKAIGVELDAKYCATIAARLCQNVLDLGASA